jgi:hypothetical protein
MRKWDWWNVYLIINVLKINDMKNKMDSDVYVVIFFRILSFLGHMRSLCCVSPLSTFEPVGMDINNTGGHTVAFFKILQALIMRWWICELVR